jgi:hypothetical protein
LTFIPMAKTSNVEHIYCLTSVTNTKQQWMPNNKFFYNLTLSLSLSLQ